MNRSPDVAGDAATTEVFRALADPRRREILRLVSDRELAAGEIAETFEVTRTAISQHITVLKEAGLLVERRAGTRRMYHTEPTRIAELRAALDDLWGAALANADRLVQAERRSGIEEAM